MQRITPRGYSQAAKRTISTSFHSVRSAVQKGTYAIARIAHVHHSRPQVHSTLGLGQSISTPMPAAFIAETSGPVIVSNNIHLSSGSVNGRLCENSGRLPRLASMTTKYIPSNLDSPIDNTHVASPKPTVRIRRVLRKHRPISIIAESNKPRRYPPSSPLSGLSSHQDSLGRSPSEKHQHGRFSRFFCCKFSRQRKHKAPRQTKAEIPEIDWFGNRFSAPTPTLDLPHLETIQDLEHSEDVVELPYMDPVSLHYLYRTQHVMLHLEDHTAYEAAPNAHISSPIFSV